MQAAALLSRWQGVETADPTAVMSDRFYSQDLRSYTTYRGDGALRSANTPYNRGFA